jgi:uncharacterized protein (DUF2126 family)
MNKLNTQNDMDCKKFFESIVLFTKNSNKKNFCKDKLFSHDFNK